MAFNPLKYPLSLMSPQMVSDTSRWLGHIPFAFAMVQMMRPQSIVELGTDRGDSYLAFCQAVAALNLNTRCSAVDVWGNGQFGEQSLARLRAAHDPHYLRFSRLIRCTFDQARGMFPDGSVDLLHLDGQVTYEAARHDFDTWLPKMSPRGVVLLHNTAVRDGDFGAWRLWEEVSRNRPHFLFEHGLGLGVLGVGSALPEPVFRFFNEAREDAATIRAYFARLGDLVAQAQYRLSVGQWLAQQQIVINAWKQRIGLTVDPASNNLDAAITDGVNFAVRLSAEVDSALVEDLRLRQELQQQQRPKADVSTNVPPITPRLVSVIICSIDDKKFTAANEMYRRLLAAVPHEIIRINDARSMTEGYNRGIDRSSGDVLLFSHDDIEFLSADFTQRLMQHLASFDLVGLAGTNLVCGPAWVSAGPPYLFGQVTHPDPRGFTVTFFGAPKRVITDIQALDGLFIATHRRVVENVRFDESLPGFHYYDIDFTYSAFLAGFKLAVVNDIHAIHHSTGDFNEKWAQQMGKFNEKWSTRLLPRPNRPLSLNGVTVKTREEIWEVVHPAHLQE
jgi:hypothetical protein